MFKEWFKTFLEEKEVCFAVFKVEHNGHRHIVDTDTVTDLILSAQKNEQKLIQKTLIELDFLNLSILPYFEHLAVSYVKTNF